MSSPVCSVIVRAHDEEEHIGRLLTGIAQQTIEDIEIILVDSGSTDATVSIANRFSVNVVNIPPEQFTFGRSLNWGCAEASGEYLVLASAHVYPVYADWLERILEPFGDPKVALTYGKQRGDRRTRFSEHQIFAKLYPDYTRESQISPFCNNANAAVRRSLWQERPYDEDLPGLEDLDWAAWALNQGYNLTYVPEALVIHIHDEGPRQVYNRYRREAIGLKRIMTGERFRLLDFVRLFLTNVAADLGHAIRDRTLLRVWWEVLWFRFMQFWGTYRGFQHVGPITRELIRTFYYPRDPGATSPSSGRYARPIEYGDVSPRAEEIEKG